MSEQSGGGPITRDPIAYPSEWMREHVATLTRERDEARAALAQYQAAGKVDPDVDAIEQRALNAAWYDWLMTRNDTLAIIARMRAAEARAALAYPRALQAAVWCIRVGYPSGDMLHPDAERTDDDHCARILALTPDDIDRITKEHEHG